MIKIGHVVWSNICHKEKEMSLILFSCPIDIHERKKMAKLGWLDKKQEAGSCSFLQGNIREMSPKSTCSVNSSSNYS